MRIYLDIIFVINFIVDALVLWMISIFDRRRVKKRWILLGAVLGSGIYCLTFLIGIVNSFQYLLFGLFALIISIRVTFKVSSVRTLCKLVTIGIISSILVGGAIIVVFNLTNIGYAVTLSMGSIKFSLVLILTFVFYLIIKYCGGFIYSMTSKRNDYCRIKIRLHDKEAEITALKDTGNFLIDDGCGNKIIICEFNATRNLLSVENQMLYLKKLDPIEIMAQLTGDIKDKAQLIPFSSLGMSEGFLTAFKVDKAEIYERESIVLENVLLVIYNGKLSTNKSCNGIINPTIIES